MRELLRIIYVQVNLNKDNKNKLEGILKTVAFEWNFEICSVKIQTNQNPIIIEVIIKKN